MTRLITSMNTPKELGNMFSLQIMLKGIQIFILLRRYFSGADQQVVASYNIPSSFISFAVSIIISSCFLFYDLASRLTSRCACHIVYTV
jgi:hypothetical protein